MKRHYLTGKRQRGAIKCQEEPLKPQLLISEMIPGISSRRVMVTAELINKLLLQRGPCIVTNCKLPCLISSCNRYRCTVTLRQLILQPQPLQRDAILGPCVIFPLLCLDAQRRQHASRGEEDSVPSLR